MASLGEVNQPNASSKTLRWSRAGEAGVWGISGEVTLSLAVERARRTLHGVTVRRADNSVYIRASWRR
jgi:hypothetical protein